MKKNFFKISVMKIEKKLHYGPVADAALQYF
jgi:hypothetical protein